MADVSAFTPDFANLSSSAAGAPQANVQETQQRAGLISQQSQTAGMQNQITRASMPLIMQAIQEAQADQSGVNPGGPDNGSANTPTTSGVQFGDHNQLLEEKLRDQNFVPPYLPGELQRVVQLTRLAGIPGMAGDYAKAQLAAVQTKRQARIDTTTATNQLKMGNMYDTATAGYSVDPNGDRPGASLQALDAIDQQDADVIRQQATDPKTGKLDITKADDMAQQHMGHVAAVSHLYSGRPTHDVNGQLVDDKTSQAVVGQKQLYTGSTSEQLGADRQWAKGTVPVTMTDGSTENQPRWSAPKQQGGLGMTPDQYAHQQDQARRKLLDLKTPSTDKGGPPVPPPEAK